MLKLHTTAPADAQNTANDDDRPLKIAVLSYRSTPHVGGQGVYVDYLTRALVEAGHQVDVLSGPPYPELDPRVNLIKIPSLDLYAQPHNGNLALRWKHLLSPTDTYEYFAHLSGKFIEPYTFGQRIFQYFKKKRPKYDVVLDNQTLTTGVLKLKTKLNIPLVTTIHHPITADRRLELEAEKSWKIRLLIKRWYAFHHMQIRVARLLPTIICPSSVVKHHIADEFGLKLDQITPVRLGVDQSYFKPTPSIQRVNNRLLTTASADVPLKGLVHLVHAYKDLLKDHPDLELRVIGKLREGPTYDLIQSLGLRDKITFKSGLLREELAKEFCEATVAVTPSLYEGFGLPAAEAMSCGAPVIVTDGGALPEVAGDAGIIVPKGDPKALQTAISELLIDPKKRANIAQACAERAADQFNWSKIAPIYTQIFREEIERTC